MKILFVNDDLQGGGKQRRLVQLIRGLQDDSSLELHLVLFDHPASASRTGRSGVSDVRELVDYPEIWEYNITVHFIERRSRRDVSVFPRFAKLLELLRPDVVNVWSTMGAFYYIPLFCIYRIPFVASYIADCNSSGFPSPWWLLNRVAFSAASAVTGNCAAGLAAYGAPECKSHVIYNGFDFARFDGVAAKSVVRADIGIKTALAVVMAARFDKSKDYQTFLDGFYLVADNFPEISAVCVGQGGELQTVRDSVPVRFRERVIFTGFRKDAEAVLSACDISVLCTNTNLHGEGVSNSIMEGMAAGHPVIATNAGGSPEIVRNGVNGFLVPPHDSGAVAAALMRLVVEPTLRQEYGDAARRTIATDFSLMQMTQEYRRVFMSVASGDMR